jgi:hypothetical protein
MKIIFGLLKGHFTVPDDFDEPDAERLLGYLRVMN